MHTSSFEHRANPVEQHLDLGRFGGGDVLLGNRDPQRHGDLTQRKR
jgi:hypothetical protein